MWENALTMDQMAAVLDNAPVAVYVSAAGSWELLYANEMAKRFMLRKTGRGLTCYQAAGFDAPCPFCRAKDMTREQLLIREFCHQATGRVYQLSGKIIDWGSKPAHIEYILDITKRKEEEQRSEELKENLQTTFSSIPCGLSVYRFDGEEISPLFHNPAFYAIMGYSKEHIRCVESQTSFLGVHPADIETLRKNVQRAVQQNGVMQYTYRVWNDQRMEYRWIHLEGSVKSQEDGTKLLYGVYSDVSERMRLEKELTQANGKMQDIINAIPGGVAVYKVTDKIETVYFSDGVPSLTGHTAQEYRACVESGATEAVYQEDAALVGSKVREVVNARETVTFEYRKQHRDGHIVWVRAQIKWIGEEDGSPLLHCVFHNITDLKEAQLEMNHLVNSIPGGIAGYRVEKGRFITTYYSDGVLALSGHSRAEFDGMIRHDALDVVYELDRERVSAAAASALQTGETLDISYRMHHKNGRLIWIHLNGRRMGPLTESTRFYAVFTGMSAETLLFQNIANETADGIYIIDQENYSLLYVNESKAMFAKGKEVLLGQKCYTALHGRDTPCEFCTLKSHEPDGLEHRMEISGTDCHYMTRFRRTNWNGIPAYVKYVRDVTGEVNIRREKERLEIYFQTVVKNLPGGVAVVRYEKGGALRPEYLSDGFAKMTGMTLENSWRLYLQDAMAGVHVDDRARVNKEMDAYIASGENHWEIEYRLRRGSGDYVWVRNTLSLIQNEGEESRVYAVYHDITREREEKEQLRRRYEEILLQHYRTPGPDELILGHCNITQNRILEIIDYTGSELLKTFGTVREEFFNGISGLVVDEGERKAFLDTYLNEPALAAFQRNDTERILKCFVKLPRDEHGRYVQFKVKLVETPYTGDITGVLTVTDITEQTISDRILHQMTVSNYDFVVDLDLNRDYYSVLTCNKNTDCYLEQSGVHSERVARMLESVVAPKDKKAYANGLGLCGIRARLEREGTYTLAYSIMDGRGDIRTKNITVSAIDLRLGRVCLARTDITDSVREQQGLLNMIAYTFELAAFLNIASARLTLYTRRTVLENLAPDVIEEYDRQVGYFFERYGAQENSGEMRSQFYMESILRRLEEKPEGYDFVFPFRTETGLHYKQVNVLWGDENHQTVCLVQADVTDILAAERQTKEALEKALILAEEANRAKSDFLSAMSHDIRTPMNAIMGMTTLAVAHLGDQKKVADSLQKISISSRHLLSLINDVLDMSKIEQAKISLNRLRVSLPELVRQLSCMMGPQAKAAGLHFDVQAWDVRHENFYGDPLRINQILINLLSNAIKFTLEGGEVRFIVEEIPSAQGADTARYRFTVSDTGVGMSEDFIAHIFEPFSRSHSTAGIEGTGLGLSVTKGLVDLMNGTIAVQSREQEGSVFCVELECEIASGAGDVPVQEMEFLSGGADNMLAGCRFLVAEDNAINAEILCELLAMHGAKTEVQVNGDKAVKAFQGTPPGTYDAILMDIQMPQMDGYEATRIIRAMSRPDARDIPIVAMTANAFAEDIQKALDAGMTAHVAKPLDMEILRATLQRVIGWGRAGK